MLAFRISVVLSALVWSGCSGCHDDSGGGGSSDAGVPTAEVTLRVLDDDARSCEVLLNEQAWQVSNVRFETAISGDFERWAPRVALAFTRGEDEPLGQVLKLELRKKREGEPTEFAKIETTCFDRLGKVIEGADVRIE